MISDGIDKTLKNQTCSFFTIRYMVKEQTGSPIYQHKFLIEKKTKGRNSDLQIQYKF